MARLVLIISSLLLIIGAIGCDVSCSGSTPASTLAPTPTPTLAPTPASTLAPTPADTPGSTLTSRVHADFTGERIVGETRTWVRFEDLSTGPVVSWEWDIDGDGTIDTRHQNPQATYRRNGVYTVTLTVRGPEEWDVDTITKEDYVEVTSCPT